MVDSDLLSFDLANWRAATQRLLMFDLAPWTTTLRREQPSARRSNTRKGRRNGTNWSTLDATAMCRPIAAPRAEPPKGLPTGDPPRGMFGPVGSRTRHVDVVGRGREVRPQVGGPGLSTGEYLLKSRGRSINGVIADAPATALYLCVPVRECCAAQPA